MAYFHFLSEIDGDCLFSAFKNLLEEAGLYISEEFSSKAQIFAEGKLSASNTSKVNVLISWNDRSKRKCSIEVRSDEPIKKGTSCESLAKQLHSLISLQKQ